MKKTEIINPAPVAKYVNQSIETCDGFIKLGSEYIGSADQSLTEAEDVLAASLEKIRERRISLLWNAVAENLHSCH